MKLSKKITIFISIIFIVIFGIIIARYFVGKHFEKKFSQRPPPGVIIEVVDNSQFFEKIETFGTAVALKTKNYRVKKEEIKNQIYRITHKLKINNNLLNKKITELSFGQQQRVSVARALIGKPEIIIADEPTSALDTHNRELFINLLLEECEFNNTTVVFVSHDPYLAKYFDKNIHMEDINASHS